MTNSTTTTINPTDIASPEYTSLVRRYRQFAKASAENIVRLAETLWVAKSKLVSFQFNTFCDEVGLDQNGSTYRKLLEIGKMASRFEPFLDRLPNAWTTVYKLASIEKDEFDRVTKSDLFSPFMTAKDVTEVLGDKSNSTKSVGSKASAVTMTIDLRDLEDSDKPAVYAEINKICEHFKVSVKLSDALKEIVDGEKGPAPTLQSFLMEQAA